MEQQLLVNQITKLHSKLGAPWVCGSLSVCRWVGFPGVFWGFFPRKCHKLAGKREESCRMMHPDSYSSCHTPPAQELSFRKPSFARKDRYMSLPRTLIRRWIHRLSWSQKNSTFFFFDWSCAIFRTQNGGLPGADEVAVWERNIAPIWSVWFLLKETFILGCPPSQVYRDPLLLVVLTTKNKNPGGDWNPRQGYDNPTFIIFWCFLKFVEPLKLLFCREDLQQEIDLAVLTLLSYLSHLGEDCWNRHEMLYICDSSHGYVFTEYI